MILSSYYFRFCDFCLTWFRVHKRIKKTKLCSSKIRFEMLLKKQLILKNKHNFDINLKLSTYIDFYFYFFENL